MMHTYRILGALTAVTLLGLSALAVETPEPHRVLVLITEATLRGHIEQEGKAYRVKNATGETLVPATKVLRICESIEAAFEFLRSQANLRDPHERIRLARWCQRHELFEQARAECDAALQLDARNVEAQRLLKSLANVKPAATTQAPAVVTEREATSREPVVRTITDHSYAPETLQSFTRKVQPILFNTCGTGACHGGAKGNGFELQRGFGNAGAPAAMTRQNLLQTLSLVDKNDPANSLLLKKSLEAHGGSSRPPFAGRDAIPFQSLEKWVASTTGSDFAEPSRLGTPKKEAETKLDESTGFAGGKPASSPVQPAKPLPTLPIRPIQATKLSESTDTPMPRVPTPPAFQGGEVVGAPPESVAQPKSPAKPIDPFDPLEFNRRQHPGKEP